MCGLSLLLVLSLGPRGFSADNQVFPHPQKPTLSIARIPLNEFFKLLNVSWANKLRFIIFSYRPLVLWSKKGKVLLKQDSIVSLQHNVNSYVNSLVFSKNNSKSNMINTRHLGIVPLGFYCTSKDEFKVITL